MGAVYLTLGVPWGQALSMGFGLRDVHVKTNGCFWSSMNAIHECVRISAAAARRRVEASTRETLISVRHFPPRHSVCTSNLAVVFGVSSVGRVHVKLDRRFRHVCPFFSLYVGLLAVKVPAGG